MDARRVAIGVPRWDGPICDSPQIVKQYISPAILNPGRREKVIKKFTRSGTIALEALQSSMNTLYIETTSFDRLKAVSEPLGYEAHQWNLDALVHFWSIWICTSVQKNNLRSLNGDLCQILLQGVIPLDRMDILRIKEYLSVYRSMSTMEVKTPETMQRLLESLKASLVEIEREIPTSRRKPFRKYSHPLHHLKDLDLSFKRPCLT